MENNNNANNKEKVIKDDTCNKICMKSMPFYSAFLRNESRRLTEIFDETVERGKSKTYANIYANLILKGKKNIEADKRATIYEKERLRGRSHNYAYMYAKVVFFGECDGKAREQSMIYEKELGSGRGHNYAYICYFND